MRNCLHLLGILLLTTSSLAQGRILIVDAANGPGANYTDLPVAVAAAQDGDTLVVRSGDYQGFSTGTRLSDETQRAILMMKQQHPEWGEDRIHSMLMRTQGLGASPGAIGRFLQSQGYEVEQAPTKPRRFGG